MGVVSGSFKKGLRMCVGDVLRCGFLWWEVRRLMGLVEGFSCLVFDSLDLVGESVCDGGARSV